MRTANPSVRTGTPGLSVRWPHASGFAYPPATLGALRQGLAKPHTCAPTSECLPGRFPRVPDTILDPDRFEEKHVDQIEIRVTNLATKERMVCLLKPRKLGFRAKTTDSLLFVKRRNTSKVEGVAAVNFAPSPGVTFGGTYLVRKNRFVRALRPGIGLNATFLNWKDPTYDPDAKKYLPNTRGAEVNIGMGVQVSLFNNVLVFSYGANLQAERSRWYYGIGLSFVQLGGKIAAEIR